MENRLVKIDPKEFGIEEKDATTIEQAFMHKIVERDAMIEIYNTVINSELTPELSKQAKEVRLKLVKVRTGIAEIHKMQKAFYLAAGRYVDAWKNKETAPIEQMEEMLTGIEKHFEKIEAERIAKIESERKTELEKYDGFVPLGLGLMEEQVYQNHLNGVKLAHTAKIEAERKAEEERQAAIKAEQERIEAQRIENERLKKEAEKREKEIAAEKAKAEAERKAIEEKAKIEREKAEAALRTEREKARIEAEKAAEEVAKLQAEIKRQADEKAAAEKAKAEAERKAEADKQAEIKRQADESAKLEKAPIKQKLTIWIDGFTHPETPVNNAVKDDILAKFESFKKWAKSEIEKL